jgi:multisubunit Na+/H+ antiporter MnhB subunit
MPRPVAADALLGLLFPFWQLVIAGCALAALLLSFRRLRARGSSRMVRALVVTGVAIIALAALGVLLDNWPSGAP